MNKIIFFIVFFLFFQIPSAASEKLPVPRFVSLKAREANARRGPGVKYPIDWVFVKKGEPVEIIAEYEQWRLVKDCEGQGGWLHKSVLSGKRYVIISSNEKADLLKNDDPASSKIASLEPGVRCKALKCGKVFCKIECSGLKGWIQRKFLWGIYPREIF